MENQYGFRKGLSTDDAIFKLIKEILDTLYNKMKTGSVFCDLLKAFDTVNHELLLDKLQYYGIKGKAKTLLESIFETGIKEYRSLTVTQILMHFQSGQK